LLYRQEDPMHAHQIRGNARPNSPSSRTRPGMQCRTGRRAVARWRLHCTINEQVWADPQASLLAQGGAISW
jgi:hypothetical protein